MEEIDYCLECKEKTNIAIDYRLGDNIYSECGLVLKDHSVSEFVKWRTFFDDNNDKDLNRVGSRENPILNQANLVTLISNPKTINKDLGHVLHSRKYSDPDTSLIKGFEIIALMANRLGLVMRIKDRANEIYKNVKEHKSCRGRKLDAVFTACLFIACKESKFSRTLKEFAIVANGVKGKEINKTVKSIKKQFELEMGSMRAEEVLLESQDG